MELRIDSVFSLSLTRDIPNENKSNISGQEYDHILGDKDYYVSVERINLGKRKHVSYRKWMKTHRHCDAKCLQSTKASTRSTDCALRTLAEVGENTNATDSTRKRKRELEVITSPKTRSKRRRGAETSTKAQNSPVTHLKETRNLVQPEVNSHISQKSSSIRPKTLNCFEVGEPTDQTASNRKCNTNAEEESFQSFKKEPEMNDIQEISLSPTNKNFTELHSVRVKKEPESDDKSFMEICEKLAKAPPEDRASYMEKLKAFLEADAKSRSMSNKETVSSNDIHPSSCNTKKEGIALRTTAPIGKLSSIVPENRKMAVPSNSGDSSNIVVTPDGTKTIAALQMLSVDGKTFVVATSDKKLLEGTSNKSTKKTGNTPPTGNTQPTRFLPPQTTLSSAALTDCQNTKPMNVTNLESYATKNKENKTEVHGHLVTHPDGKQYFVPLIGGQTFSHTPEIKLALNGQSQAIKNQMQGIIPQPTLLSQTNISPQPQQVPLSNQASKLLADLGVKIKNNLQNANLGMTPLQSNSSGNQNLIPQPVTELTQNCVPIIVSQAIPTTNLPSSTVNMNTSKMKTFQNSIKLSNTTVVNSCSSSNIQGQANNSVTLPTASQSLPYIVVPLIINGSVQNVLLNVLPDGSVKFPGSGQVGYTAVSSETNAKIGQTNSGASNILQPITMPILQPEIHNNLSNKQLTVTMPILQPEGQKTLPNQNLPVILNDGQIQLLQPETGILNPVINSVTLLNVNPSGGCNLGSTLNTVVLPNQLTNSNVLAGTPIVQSLSKNGPNGNNFQIQQPMTPASQPQPQVTHAQISQDVRLLPQTIKQLPQSIRQGYVSTSHCGVAPIQQRFPVFVGNQVHRQLNITTGSNQIDTAHMSQSEPTQYLIMSKNGSQKLVKNQNWKHFSHPLSITTSTIQSSVATIHAPIKTGVNHSSLTGCTPIYSSAANSTSMQSKGNNRKSSSQVTTGSLPSNDNRLIYSPSKLCKNAVKSKEYKHQMEENVLQSNKDNFMGVVTSQQSAAQRTVLVQPFNSQTYTTTGSGNVIQPTVAVPTVNKQTLSPTIIPAQGYSKASTSTNDLLLQKLISKSKTLVIPKIQDITPHPSSRISTSSLSTTVEQHSKNTQLHFSQDISSSHPLLHKSLQNTQPSITNDVTKRNKRKPQVVVRIDNDVIDVDDDTSSPEKDYSIFQVPSTKTLTQQLVPGNANIIEKGLRIPDSMLQDLQKKQLSVETTIQKLLQNKLVKK